MRAGAHRRLAILRTHSMSRNSFGLFNVSWEKVGLIWCGVIWFYLTLYLAGVLDIQRFGFVAAAAAFLSCGIATIVTPWLEVRRAASVDTSPPEGDKPVPPSYRRYATTALAWFGLVWVYFYAMERAAIATTGQARWPVSTLTSTLLVALAIAGFIALLAALHYRSWRRGIGK
jgi:hypothetical protein